MGGGVVERVAVAVQDVGVPVPVEIDEGDPARAEVRVRRAPEQPLPQLGAGKGPDLLPLLADEGHDVAGPVVVEVGDEGVDGAREPLQDVGLERPAAPVLEPQRLAVVVAEGGHREVEVAVAVEVAGPHVGDPRYALGRDAAREALLAVVLEHHDRADAQIAREELAQARDEQVEVAVAVEVGRLHCAGRMSSVTGASVQIPAGNWRIQATRFRIASQARMSGRPSPSRSTTVTCAIWGRSASPRGSPTDCGVKKSDGAPSGRMPPRASTGGPPSGAGPQAHARMVNTPAPTARTTGGQTIEPVRHR